MPASLHSGAGAGRGGAGGGLAPRFGFCGTAAVGFPFCPPSRRGGTTGDFGGAGFLTGGAGFRVGGAGFLVGATETAAAAGADEAAVADGVTECVCEGAAGSAGVRAWLALVDGAAGAVAAGAVPSDPPDSEQPATASTSPSTTSGADTPHGPRFRIIPAPDKTIMR